MSARSRQRRHSRSRAGIPINRMQIRPSARAHQPQTLGRRPRRGRSVAQERRCERAHLLIPRAAHVFQPELSAWSNASPRGYSLVPGAGAPQPPGVAAPLHEQQRDAERLKRSGGRPTRFRLIDNDGRAERTGRDVWAFKRDPVSVGGCRCKQDTKSGKVLAS